MSLIIHAGLKFIYVSKKGSQEQRSTIAWLAPIMTDRGGCHGWAPRQKFSPQHQPRCIIKFSYKLSLFPILLLIRLHKLLYRICTCFTTFSGSYSVCDGPVWQTNFPATLWRIFSHDQHNSILKIYKTVVLTSRSLPIFSRPRGPPRC